LIEKFKIHDPKSSLLRTVQENEKKEGKTEEVLEKDQKR